MCKSRLLPCCSTYNIVLFLDSNLTQEDYRKVTVDRKGDTNFFTSEMIKTCMKKVVTVNLHQTVQVR